jgi:hypothetical protein
MTFIYPLILRISTRESYLVRFESDTDRDNVRGDLTVGVTVYRTEAHGGPTQMAMQPLGCPDQLPVIVEFETETARAQFMSAMNTDHEITGWETPPARPQDVAVMPDILDSFHGETLDATPRSNYARLQFPDMRHVVLWAEAAGVSDRVHFPGGVKDLATRPVRVWLITADLSPARARSAVRKAERDVAVNQAVRRLRAELIQNAPAIGRILDDDA